MNRRNFLQALSIGTAGLALGQWTPFSETLSLPTLAIRQPMPYRVVDREIGISMRFIREFDLSHSWRCDALAACLAMPQIPDAVLDSYAADLAAEIDRRGFERMYAGVMRG